MARHEVTEEHGKGTQFRTGSEAARKAGRKGGKKSGEVRNLKSMLLKAMDDGGYEKMVEVAMREMDNGNPKFWELIRDTIGEKPTDKVQATVSYEDSLRSVVDEDEY